MKKKVLMMKDYRYTCLTNQTYKDKDIKTLIYQII